jgi:S-adenosylmethionine:tRNA ribosyltransferase-isomerase
VNRKDFSYELPEELIAQAPAARRGASRLLVLDGASGVLADRRFADLPGLLTRGDLLVLNDTRVIPARLLGRKDTGGAVEVLIERVLDERRVLAHVGASKPPRPGARLWLEQALALGVVGRRDDLFELVYEGAGTIAEALRRHGRVPLPPYVRRAPGPEDAERYQTVYAREEGAVAAPTAGLHFDGESLAAIARAGVEIAFVTLHVGAGTFLPVRSERVEDHRMHAERVAVSEATAGAVRAARQRGARVVAVGTTVVRALETASAGADGPAPYAGDTRLFVRPGYRFRAVDALLTNFHLPESTLLMLVCAFAGSGRALAAYRHAVAQRYRFFSYGDAMFITRSAPDARAARNPGSEGAPR